MQIGIMAKHFERPTLGEMLDAVVSHGLYSIQFNLECAGLPSMPDQIDPDVATAIGREVADRGITMAATSGTFNMIHPDPTVRHIGLWRLRTMAAVCRNLGTGVITLCTGTRDPDSMWRRHPDNDLPAAWADLLETMDQAVEIAAEHNVILAIEPEVSNVVDSAQKARRLLDTIGSPHLKVVIDGANIFHAGELPHQRRILDEAFALLGQDIVMAHAKDLSQDGEAGNQAAGTGLLDYDRYLSLLQAVGFDGSLILHGLEETEVDGCVAFLRAKLP
jgi:sugar phosphate isomerase/epimerase